jgi:spermidine synthase
MGFTMIALEILLLLAFQSLYGYVYHRLSIIIAAFMAGMALGSWRAQVRQDRGDDLPVGGGDMRSLAYLQGIAALSPVLLVVLFGFLGRIQTPTILWLSSQILFPALALACGYLGGCQFPRASRIFFASSVPATAPGGLYALDLAGSCIGAVILSIYLVPVFGFLKVASLIALINLAPWALAWLSACDAGALKMNDE